MTPANPKSEDKNKDVDFWNELPEHVKHDVESAMKESDLGLGKTHEAVMFKYHQYTAT